ncbi:MAG: hypothetical protein KKE23_04125 [Nanoarchaeota archaeon]|nr:hypothetical protein [Nanoarchaeota archaeon]
MDKQKESKFNFHCYGFDALLGLDSVRDFVDKNYNKHVPHSESLLEVYQRASKNLSEMGIKNLYLQDRLRSAKEHNSINGCAYHSMESDDEPLSEESSKLLKMLTEGLASIYNISNDLECSEILEENFNEFMKPIEKEDIRQRLKNKYGTPSYPEKGLLKRRIRADMDMGEDTKNFKRNAMYKHIISSFWSDQFSSLSFQNN